MSKLWGWLSLPQGFIIETKPHYWRQLSLTYWYIWLISKGVWFAVFMCACSKWELLICVGEEWVVAFSMWNMSLHGNVTNLPEQQCCLHVYICISLLLHFCHAVTWIIHSVALLPSLLAHFSVRLHLIWLECTLHYKIPPLKLDLCFCLFFSLCITLTQNVFCSNFFIVNLKSRIHPFYIWPNIVSQLKLLWNFFWKQRQECKAYCKVRAEFRDKRMATHRDILEKVLCSKRGQIIVFVLSDYWTNLYCSAGMRWLLIGFQTQFYSEDIYHCPLWQTHTWVTEQHSPLLRAQFKT